MNLGQIATIVGQRLGVDTSSSSTRDGAAVRAFLTAQHDALYQSYLWKDAIIELEVPINQAYTVISNYMPTKGRVILPPIFENVLGVRLGCRALDVQRAMLYYRANYGQFFSSGYATDFLLLSSCVWEFDTVQDIILALSNAADIGQNVTLDYLASDEVTVTRGIIPLVNPVTTAISTDRIDNFIKPATNGAVSLSQETGGNGPNLIPAGAMYGGGDTYNFQTLLTPGQTYQVTWGANDMHLEYGIAPFLTIVDSPGAGLTSTFTFPVGGNVAFFISTIPGISVTAQVNLYNPATYTSIVSLGASDTSAPKSQRIQLVGIPTTTSQTSQNLHILGKRNTPPFSADSDVPAISGIEAVLIPYAYYVFKGRDESGGTPDAIASLNESVGPNFLTRGQPGGFLAKLIEKEVIQAASNTRIVPDHGFGGCDYYNEPWTKGDVYGSIY